MQPGGHPQKTLIKTLASKVVLFQDFGRKLVSFAAFCSNTSFSDLRLDMQGIASRIAGRIGLAIKPRCSSDLGVSTVTRDPLTDSDAHSLKKVKTLPVRDDTHQSVIHSSCMHVGAGVAYLAIP